MTDARGTIAGGYDSASKQRWLDYHNQHEGAALIGLFNLAFSVLPPVESYRNYPKPTQRGRGTSPLCRREYIPKDYLYVISKDFVE